MRKSIYRSKKDFFLLRDVLLPIAVGVALLYLFILGVNMVERTAEREQLTALRSAVTKAAVQCYAIEGGYPPNLQYITDHYGVRYDERKFVVHYMAFASNIMPQIDVIPIGAGSGWSDGEDTEDDFLFLIE